MEIAQDIRSFVKKVNLATQRIRWKREKSSRSVFKVKKNEISYRYLLREILFLLL